MSDDASDDEDNEVFQNLERAAAEDDDTPTLPPKKLTLSLRREVHLETHGESQHPQTSGDTEDLQDEDFDDWRPSPSSAPVLDPFRSPASAAGRDSNEDARNTGSFASAASVSLSAMDRNPVATGSQGVAGQKRGAETGGSGGDGSPLPEPKRRKKSQMARLAALQADLDRDED